MATKANLVIDQGTTYYVELDLTDQNGDPLDLAAYSVTSQIRKWYTSSTPAATFNASVVLPSKITLNLTEAQTSNLVAGRYVYDVEARSTSNTVSRVLEGIVTVTPQVTR